MDDTFKTARITKDRNYDGKFFFGVKTTGIFCRPSCPAPVAKEENVIYFNDIYEAMAKHFRPCLRCRPDIHINCSSTNISGSIITDKALSMISNGFLNNHSVVDLAGEMNISDRYLRKLFVEHLGASPVQVGQYQRGLFAKKLLMLSTHSMADIAFAAGFQSIRQFNQVIKKLFGMSPSELKKAGPAANMDMENISLLLPYTKPFHFSTILSFLAKRQITGIEHIGKNSYARTFITDTGKGYFTVTDNPSQSALCVNIHCDDIRCYLDLYSRIRKMFDLDTIFQPINQLFQKDTYLAPGMTNNHVPRLPLAFDPFELAIRAVLGQQITIQAASTLASRLVNKAGKKTPNHFPEQLQYYFPEPANLCECNLENCGITRSRQKTIQHLAQAISADTLSLDYNQPLEQFYTHFSSIPGIGEWTVNYVTMRGLGMRDCFPATDLGIIKAITKAGHHENPLTRKEILHIAEKWRPYRAYAALCLWKIYEKSLL